MDLGHISFRQEDTATSYTAVDTPTGNTAPVFPDFDASPSSARAEICDPSEGDPNLGRAESRPLSRSGIGVFAETAWRLDISGVQVGKRARADRSLHVFSVSGRFAIIQTTH